ncbi:hypothetical protein BZA70DRAFT_283117 [Myxozyma melibiosi]|uniref:Uncharacterized protein n=1 Tax=Myxozyma melibiosi TaxID=54550 RepID=A0ABR1F1K6_9ASCO
MHRSQYFKVLLPCLALLHAVLLSMLALPTHGVVVSTADVFTAIGLGLAGFASLLCLRFILSLFPLASVYTTSLLLFVVGLVEEIVHFLLLQPLNKATWHPAYILGFSWSLAECIVSLNQLIPPRQYRYSRVADFDDDEFDNDNDALVPSALSHFVDETPADSTQEFDLSLSEAAEDHSLLDPEAQDQSPAQADSDAPAHAHHHHHHHHHHHRHDGRPDPASTFAAAAQIGKQQREDPIAPLIGTSLLDLPTYFPFLWRTSALLHHLGFSLLLSLQDVTSNGVLAAVIVVCLYRGVLRSIWGIGIMRYVALSTPSCVITYALASSDLLCSDCLSYRFGVVTVTFLTLVGGLLSYVVGLAIWQAI